MKQNKKLSLKMVKMGEIFIPTFPKPPVFMWEFFRVC